MVASFSCYRRTPSLWVDCNSPKYWKDVYFSLPPFPSLPSCPTWSGYAEFAFGFANICTWLVSIFKTDTRCCLIISILLFYFSVLYSILFFYLYKLFFLLRFADTDFRDDSGPQLPATSTIPDSAFASPQRAGHIAYIGFPEREISHKK